MIPKGCKRLAEVDFPIAEVSKHAVREKPIVHRHPQSLQQWWARRPLAACRSMLLSLLLPDPCDPLCPPEFKTQARDILLGKRGRPSGWTTQVGDDLGLRKILLQFIGDFANWDVAADKDYLEAARALVKAAHPVGANGYSPPLVVDPFAGGGSIPLEALRLGCEAFASDLNPVACLIEKVMLEDIPRHGPELADELRHVGAEIKAAAEKELAEFYPTDPDGARPIAYLWARTVRCESPNCGAEIPLIRSFWLSKKASRRRALRPIPQPPSLRGKGAKGVRSVEFEIFEPISEKEVPRGTVSRAKATCLCCNTVLSPDRVRSQLRDQRGGADVVFDENARRIGGARLLAVVRVKENEQGRHYRLPAERDYESVWKAMQHLKGLAVKPLPNALSKVPDEPTPAGGGSGAGRAFSVQIYGMMKFSDLFTARQKLALTSLTDMVANSVVSQEVKTLMALVVSRLADRNASLVSWDATGEKLGHVFNRQALPIVWDFVEGVPVAGATGSYENVLHQIEGAVDALTLLPLGRGQVEQQDACTSSLPDESVGIWFTDPPYYDAVPYADLSDFFFIWLKRAVLNHPLLQDRFDPANRLTPKDREVVQDETKHIAGQPKDRAFFERTMSKAFGEGRRVLKEDGLGCVVFAHKTTEGWEALLSGLIRGGWVITNSWPVATERPNRLRSKDSAALATSVHLVCRPRHEDAEVGDWSDVLRELPRHVSDWMERLQSEGVRGADLVFACIGPALEIYSRYSKVVDAEDREILLGGDPEAKEPYKRGYLAYVWEAVGRAALEQVLGTEEARARNGAAGVLEEDSRLTALFLWTLQSTTEQEMTPKNQLPNSKGAVRKEEEQEEEEAAGEDEEEEETPRKRAKGFSLVFDVARRFAQPLGIHLPEWEGRIIETEKGIVRLLSVTERAKQLFGEEGAEAVATELEERPDRARQLSLALFPAEANAAPEVKVRRRRGVQLNAPTNVSDDALHTRREATTLDRVHAAMLLQKSGRTNALRALLQAEQDRGPNFLRLANSLSALYPRDSEEKRLLDAMLLAAPR
jgi:putative DNA methylase